MLIDWFTIGAQALNFLVLVWLLKRYLYGPILAAIAAREARIADQLADAAAKEAQATAERNALQAKNDAFDAERAAVLRKATDDAHAERERLLREARDAADVLSAKRDEALRNDAVLLRASINRTTQDQVFAIARRTLADLASTTLEKQAVDVFTQRLRAMDDHVKAGLRAALASAQATEPAVVRSAFPLPPEQQVAIQTALNEALSDAVRIQFETAPDLVSGIELTTNGHKVAWSIADYLSALANDVDGLLQGSTVSPTTPVDPATASAKT